MQKFTFNGVEWLQFDHLSDCKRLVHGVFLRHGGVSSGLCASLNCGLSVQDKPENVIANKQKIKSALEIPTLIGSMQYHGDDIVHVTDLEMAQSLQGDALITEQAEIGLIIKHADCQAAIFYDPIRHVIANVHSGWRGSVKNIYEKTVEFLRLKFDTKPENLLVGISPSLGPQAAEFRNYKEELPSSFWPFIVKPLYFDFWEISKMQLLQAGLLEHHIEIARICTFNNFQDWFSYRKEKQSGRNATVVALKVNRL